MRLISAFALLALAAQAAWAAGPPGETAPISAPAITWPEGEGKLILEQKCLFCHSGEYIVVQRLNPAQWKSEVAKMVKFGSPLTAAEQVTLTAYLAKHYPPDAPAAKAPRIELKPAPIPSGAAGN